MHADGRPYMGCGDEGDVAHIGLVRGVCVCAHFWVVFTLFGDINLPTNMDPCIDCNLPVKCFFRGDDDVPAHLASFLEAGLFLCVNTCDGSMCEKFIVFSGEHNDARMPEGKGRLAWYEDGVMTSSYEGEFKNGMRWGEGTQSYKDGSVYTGEWVKHRKEGKGVLDRSKMHEFVYTGFWKADEMNGQGVFQTMYEEEGADNWTFSGTFLNGQKHGEGVLKFRSDGSWIKGRWVHDVLTKGTKQCKDWVYTGPLKNYEPHGKGQHEDLNEIYEGEYFEGQMHGHGKRNLLDVQEVYEGAFKNGLYDGFGELKTTVLTYKGMFKSGMMFGRGVLTTRLSVYDGDFYMGNKHGHGEIKYKNGDRYVGEMRKGRRSGEGSEYLRNGDAYHGQWKNDEKNGSGVEKLIDGEVYRGQFKRGQRHGRGTETQANGSRFCGVWKEGERVMKKRPRPETDCPELTCPICLDATKDVVLDRCRHTLCNECVTRLHTKCCPLCKQGFKNAELIYL